MQNGKNHSRREFLKIAAGVAGAVLVAGGHGVVSEQQGAGLRCRLWRLNPAFKLREISASEIEISTTLGTGERLRHRFQKLEAELLRSAADEKIPAREMDDWARRYGLTPEACQHRVDRALKALSDARLIYSGERMLVKIVEVSNG